MQDNEMVGIVLSIVFFTGIVLVVISIVLIISKKTDSRTKITYKFILGIAIMVISFLGGFTIGTYTILFAVALWFHLLTNFKEFKIRIASGVLLAITLVETWFLKPG